MKLHRAMTEVMFFFCFVSLSLALPLKRQALLNLAVLDTKFKIFVKMTNILRKKYISKVTGLKLSLIWQVSPLVFSERMI